MESQRAQVFGTIWHSLLIFKTKWVQFKIYSLSHYHFGLFFCTMYLCRFSVTNKHTSKSVGHGFVFRYAPTCTPPGGNPLEYLSKRSALLFSVRVIVILSKHLCSFFISRIWKLDLMISKFPFHKNSKFRECNEEEREKNTLTG